MSKSCTGGFSDRFSENFLFDSIPESNYASHGRAYHSPTKPLPAPPVPGKTEGKRLDNAVRKMFTASKEEMQRREAEWQRTQGKKPEQSK